MKRLPFRARRMATAGVIGAVIMFAMLFTVGTSFFIFVNSSNLLYTKSLESRTTGIQDNLYESALVGVILSSNHIQFYVTNTGSLPLNVTQAYVLDSSNNVLKCLGIGIPTGSSCYYSTTALSAVVNLGQVSATIDSGYTYVSGTDTVKIITSRGNVYSGGYPVAPNQQLQATVAQAIGSLVIVEGSFRFYSCDSQNTGDGYPVKGYYGYTIANTKGVAYSMSLTNNDASQRSITLNQKALVTQTTNGVPSSNTWYIVQSFTDSSPYTGGVTPVSYSSNVVINYGQTKTLNFSAKSPGANDCQKTIASNQAVGVFLLFYGTYSDNSLYAQTIPFVAQYTTAAQVTTNGPFTYCRSSSHTWSLSGFSSAPNVYWVPAGGSTLTDITGTTSVSSAAVNVPSGASNGYYEVMLADGINAAYATVQVNC